MRLHTSMEGSRVSCDETMISMHKFQMRNNTIYAQLTHGNFPMIPGRPLREVSSVIFFGYINKVKKKMMNHKRSEII